MASVIPEQIKHEVDCESHQNNALDIDQGLPQALPLHVDIKCEVHSDPEDNEPLSDAYQITTVKLEPTEEEYPPAGVTVKCEYDSDSDDAPLNRLAGQPAHQVKTEPEEYQPGTSHTSFMTVEVEFESEKGRIGPLMDSGEGATVEKKPSRAYSRSSNRKPAHPRRIPKEPSPPETIRLSRIPIQGPKHSLLSEDSSLKDLNQPPNDINHSTNETETNSKDTLVENQCSFCLRQFRRYHDLVRHLRTHTGEKPHECPVCNKRFSEKKNLKTHSIIHTGEKPFECVICKSRFTVKSTLVLHLRTHTGEKPYGCMVCKKRFSEKHRLKLHIRTHTGEKPYECHICQVRFTVNHKLQKHLKTHNMIEVSIEPEPEQ